MVPRNEIQQYFLNVFKKGGTIENTEKKGEIIRLKELLGFGSETLIFSCTFLANSMSFNKLIYSNLYFYHLVQDHKDRALKAVLFYKDFAESGS